MKKGLGELKQYLPPRYCIITLQQKEFKQFSRSYVSQVALGKLTNWKMLDFLRKLAEENMRIDNKVIETNKRIKK